MSGSVHYEDVYSTPADAAAKLESIGQDFQAAVDAGDTEAASRHLFREFQLKLSLAKETADLVQFSTIAGGQKVFACTTCWASNRLNQQSPKGGSVGH